MNEKQKKIKAKIMKRHNAEMTEYRKKFGKPNINDPAQFREYCRYMNKCLRPNGFIPPPNYYRGYYPI